MSYTSTGGLPTIPRLAVAGVDEGAPETVVTSGSPASLTSLTLPAQAVAPAAPASGVVLYANAAGRLSWRSASDTFSRSIIVTATANRTFTAPDADFTFAGQNLANTFTLANTFQAQTTFPTGSAAAPAFTFTGFQSGLWQRGSGTVGIAINGADSHAFGSTSFSVNSINGTIGIGGDAIISRKAAANWQLGAADAASPVAQTLSVQSVVAGTSNTAGANWTQRGSLGTGTGASGNIVFQLGTPAASGTTQHTASTGLTLSNVGTSGTAAHRATFAGTVATAGYTVATLPAAGTAGRRAYVTDATAPTYLGALTGGGAVVCPVFDNGTAWVSA